MLENIFDENFENTVNISKLRNHISDYYNAVSRNGGTIFILKGSQAGAVLIDTQRYNKLHKLESILESLELLMDNDVISVLKEVQGDINFGKWKKWKSFENVTGEPL